MGAEKAITTSPFDLTYQHRMAIGLLELKRAGGLKRILPHLYYPIVLLVFILMLVLFRERVFAISQASWSWSAFVLGTSLMLVSFASAQMIFCWLYNGTMTRIMRRRQPTLVTLDATGVVETVGERRSQYPWSSVSDVVERRDDIFLFVGGGESYVLPGDALPAGLERQEVVERIAAWREAAS